MGVALTGSPIAEEHRALIDMTLSGFWSIEARMHEVFKGLFRGFKVCFNTSLLTSFLYYSRLSLILLNPVALFGYD